MQKERDGMEKGFTYDALVSGTVETYQILESMYDLIDLSDGRTYERTAEQFPRPMRLIFAVDSYMAEVYNGGHDQFFFNSTGIVWKDALEGLEAIGAQVAASILRRVIGRFDCGIPDDADERRKKMDDLEDGIFEEDDQTFYDMSENIEELEKNYIQQNANAFV